MIISKAIKKDLEEELEQTTLELEQMVCLVMALTEYLKEKGLYEEAANYVKKFTKEEEVKN